ncbi:hypothetical protein MOO12_20215, partial [Escherichia coli]|nr:hypothetical protein [Escherichia coli]
LMMNPVPWLQMTNMISYQGLVRTFLSGFYCNFETLKMVGIRFFSRFCQFDCPQLWSRPSPTAYRIVSQ